MEIEKKNPKIIIFIPFANLPTLFLKNLSQILIFIQYFFKNVFKKMFFEKCFSKNVFQYLCFLPISRGNFKHGVISRPGLVCCISLEGCWTKWLRSSFYMSERGSSHLSLSSSARCQNIH